MLNKIIYFFIENKVFSFVLLLLIIGWGLIVSPLNINTGFLPHDPIPVDAIPDLGENQQIVYTSWVGQSPEDVENQITYPLTTQLLTVPGVKTVRSTSIIGLSTIYLIFDEDVDFYWSRTRVLETLNSLPKKSLPDGVQPSLGPDASALGQVFWYTLEGRDEYNKPVGGWDPQELRSIQDYYVGYALSSADGVAEVAPIGGFVKEYQVDINPNLLKIHNLSLNDVFKAVRKSNVEVAARTIELNNAEYIIRGLGYIESLEDLEETVVKVIENSPIKLRDIAFVSVGPAMRRGALDKGGAEAVGAVVIARQGENPQQVIENIKLKIKELSPGLPSKSLIDGTESKVTIVPFYDRSELINETLGTLEEALTLQIFITIIVIVVMLLNLRISFLISLMLPLAVLMTFIAMKYGKVDANIVALSGIAIAIGTIVDVGVILSENILRYMARRNEQETLLDVIYNATIDITPALLTAVTTTIVSFLPVFTMIEAEGKLFKPLAYTKTFALVSSIIIAITFIPPLAYWFFSIKLEKRLIKGIWNSLLVIGGTIILFVGPFWAGISLIGFGVINGLGLILSSRYQNLSIRLNNVLSVCIISWLLTQIWLPLGPSTSINGNLFFVILLIGFILLGFWVVIKNYHTLISWCLENKISFLSIPSFFVLLGLCIWFSFGSVFKIIGNTGLENTRFWSATEDIFPGLGKEFMPALDEGSFLLMPSTMAHVGVEESIDIMQKIDMAVSEIPEVEMVIGKMGRTNSALDPAPISMFENLIQYKSEYKTDEFGHRLRFLVDENNEYVRDDSNALIPDKNGHFYRQWRNHIHSPDDIWNEIIHTASIPGVTSAPKLQPIQTRLLMLQSGMRSPMGIKIKGSDLETIEKFGIDLSKLLKEVPGINTNSIFADRIIGKPYLEIQWNRSQLARYGLSIEEVQNYISIGIGGVSVSTTIEGRERYPIRVRLASEFRNSPEAIEELLVPTPMGTQIPLSQLANIKYRQGPQAIKSEDTFLVGYVTFDKTEEFSEIEVVDNTKRVIDAHISNGTLQVPIGVKYELSGTYEHQVRAEERLAIILPLALLLIFMIMYFQFRSIMTTGIIFSGIFVAWSGGFLLLWLYNQSWFLDFDLFGTNMRVLFQIGNIHLSVAVWVGFLALFGIASDGGVVMASYLDQLFKEKNPSTKNEIRAIVIEASSKRIRPTLITTATTILALLPVLTSTGRGADIMVPMAIPSVGGMLLQVITLFVVPVLYAMWKEYNLKRSLK